MRTAASTAACDAPAVASPVSVRAATIVRLADYLILTKPRISVLVLLTVSAGYALGSRISGRGSRSSSPCSASPWSPPPQHFQPAPRTRQRRPHAADDQSPASGEDDVGPPGAALRFVHCTLGVVWLALFVNVATAVLSGITLVLYAGLYTPSNAARRSARRSGRFPGAPPVLGWAAAGAPLDSAAFSLFAILFLWQFPHFLAIAWIYRDEYAQAGLRMLPVRGAAARHGPHAVGYALALVPLSLFPSACGLAGSAYIAWRWSWARPICAAVRFAANESQRTARLLLWTSLVYLPVLLVTLVWDHFSLLSYRRLDAVQELKKCKLQNAFWPTSTPPAHLQFAIYIFQFFEQRPIDDYDSNEKWSHTNVTRSTGR